MTEFRKTKRVKQHNPQSLSQPEINFLLTGLTAAASTLQADIKDARQTKGYLWTKCIPNDTEGEMAFEQFSEFRTALKRMRVDLKKIESVIRKLKSQR